MTAYTDSQMADQIARKFHAEYERLAPSFDYVTRKDSRVPFDDLPANNKALMLAVCRSIISDLRGLGEQAAVLQLQQDDTRDIGCPQSLGGEMSKQSIDERLDAAFECVERSFNNMWPDEIKALLKDMRDELYRLRSQPTSLTKEDADLLTMLRGNWNNERDGYWPAIDAMNQAADLIESLARSEAEARKELAEWKPKGDGDWTDNEWLRNQLCMANQVADLLQSERDEARAELAKAKVDAERYRWLRQYLVVAADAPEDWTCWLALNCIPYRSKESDAQTLLDEIMAQHPIAARAGEKDHNRP